MEDRRQEVTEQETLGAAVAFHSGLPLEHKAS